jgi:uncharacterized protein YbaP (TraB family)
MIKPGKRIAGVLSIFCALFIFLTPAYAQNQKNFLWKVQSKTNTVYILGSIHFMKKDIYPLHKNIEEAFDSSGTLVVEADVNDVSKVDTQKLMETAFYPGEDTLEKHLSRETFEMVKKEFEQNGFPIWIVNKQKPWFLALSLTALELVKAGFDPDNGIDMHFLSKASGKKKIRELESVDYQIKLLSGFSDEEQEAFLLYTLKDLKVLNTEVEALVKAWTIGDTKSMEALIEKSIHEDKRISSILEKLLYERNKNMISKIEGFLTLKEPHFIIIGAGHLVGERGIIELLRKKGYIVTQL